MGKDSFGYVNFKHSALVVLPGNKQKLRFSGETPLNQARTEHVNKVAKTTGASPRQRVSKQGRGRSPAPLSKHTAEG